MDRIFSIDTETTGLEWYKKDSIFSIILASQHGKHYIDFPGIDGAYEALKQKLALSDNIIFMQNAKFDMHMLSKAGFEVKGKIYDLKFLDRIKYNQHESYSLKDIAKRYGDEKLDIVMNYVNEHDLWERRVCPITGRETKAPMFYACPKDMVVEYAEQDAKVTLDLGRRVLRDIQEEDSSVIDPSIPKQEFIVDNESRLVHTLYKMEKHGIQSDFNYAMEAYTHYKDKLQDIGVRFKESTGLDFVKGTTVFEQVFASEQDKWVLTNKGNWQWDSDVLRSFENPVAKIALEYAEAKKQSEYFENILFYADSDKVVHPSMDQAGTVTGRLSCRDPNMQNLTNPDKYADDTHVEKYSVRRAYIPRPGFFFAMLDFQQVEFRVFLDKARANGMIDEVLKGLDVHTAAANLAGVSRKEAKTCNFLTVYGGGVAKLAHSLYETKGSLKELKAIYKNMLNFKITPEEKEIYSKLSVEMKAHNIPLIRKAWDVQKAIFKAAPELKDMMKAVQKTAENRGYIFNKYGRRYQFPKKEFCYKAPNHLIQGECADIIKIAMNRIDDLLSGKRSRMLLQVHDELIFEIAYGEEGVIDDIKSIMESVYKYVRLPLLVDVEISEKNLADKIGWPVNH